MPAFDPNEGQHYFEMEGAKPEQDGGASLIDSIAAHSELAAFHTLESAIARGNTIGTVQTRLKKEGLWDDEGLWVTPEDAKERYDIDIEEMTHSIVLATMVQHRDEELRLAQVAQEASDEGWVNAIGGFTAMLAVSAASPSGIAVGAGIGAMVAGPFGSVAGAVGAGAVKSAKLMNTLNKTRQIIKTFSKPLNPIASSKAVKNTAAFYKKNANTFAAGGTGNAIEGAAVAQMNIDQGIEDSVAAQAAIGFAAVPILGSMAGAVGSGWRAAKGKIRLPSKELSAVSEVLNKQKDKLFIGAGKALDSDVIPNMIKSNNGSLKLGSFMKQADAKATKKLRNGDAEEIFVEPPPIIKAGEVKSSIDSNLKLIERRKNIVAQLKEHLASRDKSSFKKQDDQVYIALNDELKFIDKHLNTDNVIVKDVTRVEEGVSGKDKPSTLDERGSQVKAKMKASKLKGVKNALDLPNIDELIMAHAKYFDDALGEGKLAVNKTKKLNPIPAFARRIKDAARRSSIKAKKAAQKALEVQQGSMKKMADDIVDKSVSGEEFLIRRYGTDNVKDTGWNGLMNIFNPRFIDRKLTELAASLQVGGFKVDFDSETGMFPFLRDADAFKARLDAFKKRNPHIPVDNPRAMSTDENFERFMELTPDELDNFTKHNQIQESRPSKRDIEPEDLTLEEAKLQEAYERMQEYGTAMGTSVEEFGKKSDEILDNFADCWHGRGDYGEES